MKAEKDKKTGKWLIQFRYTDWQGVRRKTTKRGFATKREAEEYVRNFLASQQADFDMNFQEFLKLYYEDMTPRLRENTMRNKKYIIDLKILPYFSNKRMNGITAAYLVMKADRKTGTCYPSAAKIAADCNISISQVRKVTASLEEKGFITKEMRYRKTANDKNHQTLKDIKKKHLHTSKCLSYVHILSKTLMHEKG